MAIRGGFEGSGSASDGSDCAMVHGKRLRVVGTADKSIVSRETELILEQNGMVFCGRYRGGSVLEGFLVGVHVEGAPGDVTFRYVQADTDKHIDSGFSKGRFEKLLDGRLRLTEDFEWLSRPGSARNVFEEI